MDDIIAKAIARRRTLLGEVREIDQFIEMYKRLKGETMPTESVSPEPVTSGGYHRVVVRPTITSTAAAILREHGRPMSVRELIEQLSQRGVPVGGTNPRINAASIFSKSSNLRFVPQRGWWLKGAPVPRQDGDLLPQPIEEKTE